MKKTESLPHLKDGLNCQVINGTHKGKSGKITDINTSKTGHVTITVVQKDGVKFKTLGRNVEVVGKVKKDSSSIHKDILAYHKKLKLSESKICSLLSELITKNLSGAENKVWHAHPVWFIDENPIVGYSLQKAGVRLMFWSGASFEEESLNVVGKKFKDASIIYSDMAEINEKDLKRWLKKSKSIQWDYKNIVKRKGKLERLK